MGLGIAPTRFTVPEFPAGNDRAGRNFTLVSLDFLGRTCYNQRSFILFMDGGVVVEEGPAKQLIDHPREQRTRQFLAHYAE